MILRRFLISTFLLLFFLQSNAQYWHNKEQKFNQGDAQWIVYQPESRFIMPAELKESSGLLYYDGLLWTHNDSGGEPVIYGMDTLTGEIVRRVTLAGAKNVDWEDITQDDEFIYVGDFGNNQGARTDLVIYRIKKTDMPSSAEGSLNADQIRFSFSDQKVFDNKFQQHDFDCEAVVAAKENLFLFSKSWKSKTSKIYKIPKEPGEYNAVAVDSIEVDGLTTGAAFDETGKRLALIGYNEIVPFLLVFTGLEKGKVTGGDTVRIELPFLEGVQSEGVDFLDTTMIVFSCEDSKVEQQVFNVPVPEPGKMLSSRESIPEYFDNWQVILYEKKKKSIREIVVDITGMQYYTFTLYFQDIQNKVFHLPDYYFDRQMGKLYMRFNARHLGPGKYSVILRSGYGEWIKGIVIR